ncbi:uncharacterized protein LOC144660559 isoform X3 [Oculina patagonica]
MKGYLLSIFVFFAVLATVYGLKCYTCIGTEDACAKDKLDSSKETSCPSGMDKCMRTWAKKDDATAVVNSCSNDASCKAAQDVCDKSSDGECAVGCCDTDLCNAGSHISFSVFLMTVCAALGLALLK